MTDTYKLDFKRWHFAAGLCCSVNNPLTRLSLMALFFALAPFGDAKSGSCDLSVSVRSSDPLAYKSRAGRCEGRYIETLSGDAISVVSFTKTFENYKLQSGKPLHVTWTIDTNTTIYLVAKSIKPKTYYQMDTELPASEKTFEWPIKILSGLNLKSREIGVIGFYEAELGDFYEKILVPIEIKQTDMGTDSNDKTLLIRPGVQLHEVYVSLVSTDGNGKEVSLIQDEEPLGLGFYPAERVFPVPLRNLTIPGIYRLTIAAEPTNSAAVLVKTIYLRNVE